MLLFEQKAEHSSVQELFREMESKDFQEYKEKIYKKLPPNLQIEGSVLFSMPGEDYLEWIDIVESVKNAKDKFVMFELGAGYGRWCINALYALNHFNPIPYHFVAVEAEDTHYHFLQQFFTAHALPKNSYELIRAAIDTKKGSCFFDMGDPNGWYGQSINKNHWSLRQKLLFKWQSFFTKSNPSLHKYTKKVPTITLNSLLKKFERIDLIDMDVQGVEFDIINASIDLLSKKVKRLHIGTHSEEIDQNLLSLLSKEGWENIHSYPVFTKKMTPYGLIEFNDGIQSWINPKLR